MVKLMRSEEILTCGCDFRALAFRIKLLCGDERGGAKHKQIYNESRHAIAKDYKLEEKGIRDTRT